MTGLRAGSRHGARRTMFSSVFCKTGERKHRIAEDYLAQHTMGGGSKRWALLILRR